MANRVLILLSVGLLGLALSACALSYTRKTTVCQPGPPPVCTEVKDSVGLELEKG